MAGSLTDCRLIEIPAMRGSQGDLAYIEGGRSIPFHIERIFYIKDVPEGGTRAGHALKACEQLIIAIHGAFDVVADDGGTRERWRLERSSQGLYLPKMIWRELENFSPGAICLVLASEAFSDASYLRDYAAFKAAAEKLP
jgi:hypothetical protein